MSSRALLTYAQAGETLGVSAKVVATMCRRGELPRIVLSPKKHRIDPDELDKFLKRRPATQLPRSPGDETTQLLREIVDRLDAIHRALVGTPTTSSPAVSEPTPEERPDRDGDGGPGNQTNQ